MHALRAGLATSCSPVLAALCARARDRAMIEIFILALIALKALGLISISWTVVIVISLALILVKIRLYQNKKALLDGLLSGAKFVDDKLDDIEYRLDSKQDRNESNW